VDASASHRLPRLGPEVGAATPSQSVPCAVQRPVRPTNVDHDPARADALLAHVAQGAECQLLAHSRCAARSRHHGTYRRCYGPNVDFSRGSPRRCRGRQRDGEPLLRDGQRNYAAAIGLGAYGMMVSTTLGHSAIHAADHLPDLESGPCAAGAAHRWDHPEDRAAVQ
jgi:hypothetical protein